MRASRPLLVRLVAGFTELLDRAIVGETFRGVIAERVGLRCLRWEFRSALSLLGVPRALASLWADGPNIQYGIHRWNRGGVSLYWVFGRGTQVVRERSAKPSFVGSIPTRASSFCLLLSFS